LVLGRVQALEDSEVLEMRLVEAGKQQEMKLAENGKAELVEAVSTQMVSE